MKTYRMKRADTNWLVVDADSMQYAVKVITGFASARAARKNGWIIEKGTK